MPLMLFQAISDKHPVNINQQLFSLSKTHIAQNFCTPQSLCILSSRGTFNIFLYFSLLVTSIGPVTDSPNSSSICFTHLNRACSTSGLVTTQTLLEERAVGLELSFV